MKERIRLIMENEQLTPSAFADMLQIGRAVMSHILNGRNNPSLDVVTRILEKLPKINSAWLLSGEGEMYKYNRQTSEYTYVNNKSEQKSAHEEPDLFAQNTINQGENKVESEYRKEIVVKPIENVIEEPDNNKVIYSKTPDKKITKIIIYYSDNTFETFDANNRPF